MTFFLSIPTEGLAFKVWNASGNDERYQVEFKPRFRLDKYVFTRTGLVIGDFLKNSGFFSGGDSYVSFNTVRARMLLWLNDLVIPNVGSSAEADLWSQYRKERGKLRRPSPAGWNTSKFSKSEREQIQRSIGTFRLAIIDNFDPSEEQLQRIEDQLDYLTKSLYTLNKFDWQSVALCCESD